MVSLLYDLKVEQPIRVVSKIAFSHLGKMVKLRPFLTPVNTKNGMHGLITGRLYITLLSK